MESKTATKLNVKDELKRLLPDPAGLWAWCVLAVVVVWYSWSSVMYLLRSWTHEDYQHGFVVPFFALYLLWIRRDQMKSFSLKGSWWGLPFFALWIVMRLTAIYYNYGTLPELSLLPFFVGVAIFVGGWQGLNWAWPSIMFLFFMIPLPGAVQGLASAQLQRIATALSVYVIQTIGIPSVAQGNVIHLSDRPLEIARACSGLRMMMLFFAICIAAAFVTRRPLWEKLLIIASAPPIAILSNVVRIVITAIVYEIAALWPSVIDVETVGDLVHQWAGYLMMPVGLLLLLLEISLLSRLLVAPPDRPLVMGDSLAKEGAAAAPFVAPRRRRYK